MAKALQKPAQIYSVYDYDTRQYRYFATPLGDVPATGHFRPAHKRIAEGLAVPLPEHATFIGEGPNAQGLVATTDAGLSPITTFLLVGSVILGGWLIWRAVRPRENPIPRPRKKRRRHR